MRDRAAAVLLSGVLACVSGGCDSLGEKGVEGGSKLVVPTDARAVAQPLSAPPPISGGTLAVSPDGAFAVASDPDRDRISIVDLATHEVRQIALQAGDEPGRVITDAHGRAYIALRGSGALLTVDTAAATSLERTPVCAAPRGLALQATLGLLHVACADGRLVSLRQNDHTIARNLKLDGDLRDVLVSGEQLQVSTFKSSALLTIAADGAVLARSAPDEFAIQVLKTTTSVDGSGSFTVAEDRLMQPHMGWRAVQALDGSVLMLHQAHAETEVDIEPDPNESSPEASPYGGGGSSGGSCNGVVMSSVTRLGTSTQTTVNIGDSVLNVDAALDPLGQTLAVVESGSPDDDAPRPFVASDRESGAFLSPRTAGLFPKPPLDGTEAHASASRVRLIPLEAMSGATDFGGCAFGLPTFATPGQATAVAYMPNGTLLIQSREPALLSMVGPSTSVIDLGGVSVRDTGHDLFHRNTGAGIACASCHGEGAEDGHTWNFTGQGLRRTQALHVGLEGTAPFHWAGDEADLDVLMEDVFVGRMGGVHQSPPRVNALARFLFALQPPAPSVSLQDPSAQRGKALFESAATACTTCHAGEKLTDNKSYDVGTSSGEKLQVPSLRGIGYRAPFLHTGCAQTLHQRFDPSCGGAQHGDVAHLAQPEIDDLVAYLQTL